MIENREAYLIRATNQLGPYFLKQGYAIPENLKISVGIPFGSRKAIGQYWAPESSDDNKGTVFIAPTINDSVEVLATLVHEIVHHVVGPKEKHNSVFRKCAVKVGLEGKMTATTPGPELVKFLKTKIEVLGKYPHARLNLNLRPTKKQTTRMKKMECGSCGYIARTSTKNIEHFGAVICPCNGTTMEVSQVGEN